MESFIYQGKTLELHGKQAIGRYDPNQGWLFQFDATEGNWGHGWHRFDIDDFTKESSEEDADAALAALDE